MEGLFQETQGPGPLRVVSLFVSLNKSFLPLERGMQKIPFLSCLGSTLLEKGVFPGFP